MTEEAKSDLTRPIIGIENRTAQEAFDIMCDRIRRARLSPGEPRGEALAEAVNWLALEAANLERSGAKTYSGGGVDAALANSGARLDRQKAARYRTILAALTPPVGSEATGEVLRLRAALDAAIKADDGLTRAAWAEGELDRMAEWVKREHGMDIPRDQIASTMIVNLAKALEKDGAAPVAASSPGGADGLEPVAWRPQSEAPNGCMALVRFRSGEVGVAYKTRNEPPFLQDWRWATGGDRGAQAPWPEEYVPLDAVLALLSRPPEAAAEIEALRARVGVLEKIANRPLIAEPGKGDFGKDRERCPSCHHAWHTDEPPHHASNCDREAARQALQHKAPDQ